MDWVIQKNDDCISDGSGDLGNYWDWKPGDAYLSAGAVTSNVTDMLAYARMQNFEFDIDYQPWITLKNKSKEGAYEND